MIPLGAFELLDVWEDGRSQSPVQRALLLLRAAWPEYAGGSWGQLPIGVRDQWLVALRAQLFGSSFELLADCPSCGTALETGFDASDLPVSQLSIESYQLDWKDWRVTYRLPNSNDLIGVLESGDTADPAEAILERCVQTVRQGRRKSPANDICEELRGRVVQAMAERDVAAQIDVGVICSACQHKFEQRFDIVGHLWDEVGEWAERLLAEIHLLASAYGWSEETVLKISPARRQHYIELVAA